MNQKINWFEKVIELKEDLIRDTQTFLQIKSVKDEMTANEDAPFGQGVHEALLHMLSKGEQEGFIAKNLDGYAGHLEFGEGEDLLGILCHVDVVPEGDGWTSEPFSAEIRNGNIYARGAIDDKGPTMAAYYAMKIVKDLNVKMNKRVRMIIGTDEESDWLCMDHYFKHEEMPSMGFAPDADFPIIFAEKGIADLEIDFPPRQASEENQQLISFKSGRRFNMVPDDAKAVIKIDQDSKLVVADFNAYLSEHNLKGSTSVRMDELHLQVEGISAHGSEPTKGKSAGLYLAKFLNNMQLDEQAETFISFICEYLVDDYLGEKLGIQVADDESGDLTVNVGIFEYALETGGKIGLNIRYPVTHQFEQSKAILSTLIQKYELGLTVVDDSKPHYVPKDTAWLKTLQRVYEEQTGEKGELISIGGGTYARVLESGVAFGPLFPGSEEVAHQKDEYMNIEDMLKATAIYAQAIFELAIEK